MDTKTAKNKIYVLCAVNCVSNSRAWSWFSTMEGAVECLHENTDYLCESGYYKWAVIEEIEEGSIIDKVEHWFKVDYRSWSRDGQHQHAYDIVPMVKSPFRQTVNWSMG